MEEANWGVSSEKSVMGRDAGLDRGRSWTMMQFQWRPPAIPQGAGMTLLSCPSWGLVVGFGTSTVTSHRFRLPSEKGHEMKALFAWVLEQQPEILRVGRMSTPFLRGTWAAHCPLAT